uniref:Uncharacterized protein n=1 Tax=Arundo donax TaxID=35708 RepID=A0A0A9A000_ARUDO
MSRGADPEGCLHVANPWTDHGHGGGRMVITTAPDCHEFGCLVRGKVFSKGPSTRLKGMHFIGDGQGIGAHKSTTIIFFGRLKEGRC